MTLSLADETVKMRFFGYFTVAGLLATILVWGTLAQLSSAIVASGSLEVATYRQVVQHETGGSVDKLMVKNGDRVKLGDLLLSLDGSLILPEYEIQNRRYIETLAEKGRLIAERDQLGAPVFPPELLEIAKTAEEAKAIMDSQVGLFEYRRDAARRESEIVGERLGQSDEKISGALAELKAIDDQIAQLEPELQRNLKLVKKGIIGEGSVTNMQMQKSGLEGSKGQLEAGVAAARDEKSAMEIELLNLKAKPREEAIARLRELETLEVEIFQRRASLGEQLNKLNIMATAEGTVYGMTVFNANTVVGSGAPLMYIVQDDQPLIIRARIKDSEVSDVFVGQEAEIKFPSFNQRTTPFIAGKVINISADSITDERTGGKYYELEVEPEKDVAIKIGDNKLQPGQPAEVFVNTGSQTFLDYLLKPLKDNFARTFREH